MPLCEFDGTVTVSSDRGRFDVVGSGDQLFIRFDRLSDLRTAWRSSKSFRKRRGHWVSRTSHVFIELGGRPLATFGPVAAPLWSPAGVLSRLTGLPLTHVHVSGLLGR